MNAGLLKSGLGALLLLALSFICQAKNQVPIRGGFVTEFAFTAPPPVAGVILTGDGWVSHLGRATCFSPDEVVDFTAQPLPSLTGTLQITAANGDQLIGQMNAQAIPALDGSITFAGTLTFTGGTGRFAGATGSAELSGEGTPTSPFGGIGRFVIKGSVSAPGTTSGKTTIRR